MPSRTLVIARGNAGKIREFAGLLAHLPVNLEPQPAGMEVEETGSTFSDNARIKALAVAQATGHWALADDSGLCVDALDGAPGCFQRGMPTPIRPASIACYRNWETPTTARPISVPRSVSQRRMARCWRRWRAVALG